MKIIQITDLHIGKAGAHPYEVDVRGNFLRILDKISAVSYDLLVISGDLCYSVGDLTIYKWIKETLDRRQLNYVVIPGNHDDTTMMIDVFGGYKGRKELYFSLHTDSCPLFFLDSQSGQLSKEQLLFLDEELQKTQQGVCLFIHHPPVKMGVPYMDNKHAMQDTDDLLAILEQHPYPISIFSGHYHVDKSVRRNNLDIHVTPSCFFQIDWTKEDFGVDHYRCAYRCIEWNGQELEHAVVYIEAI